MDSYEDPQLSYECDRESELATLRAENARLVEALRTCAKRCDPSPAADAAFALLRELGEAA